MAHTTNLENGGYRLQAGFWQCTSSHLIFLVRAYGQWRILIPVLVIMFGFNAINSEPLTPSDFNHRMIRMVYGAVICLPAMFLFFAPISVLAHRLRLPPSVPFVSACFFSFSLLAAFEFAIGFPDLDFALLPQVLLGTSALCIIGLPAFIANYRNTQEHLVELHGQRTPSVQNVHHIPALMKHLPPQKRGALLELMTTNKFTEIRTENGEHRIRIPLREAVDHIPVGIGYLIHRSHWVAFSEMEAIFYESGNPRLRLVSGEIRPLSRKSVPEVKSHLENRSAL